MADYLATDTDMTTVANAIRSKGDTSAALAFPNGFASAIGSIKTVPYVGSDDDIEVTLSTAIILDGPGYVNGTVDVSSYLGANDTISSITNVKDAQGNLVLEKIGIKDCVNVYYRGKAVCFMGYLDDAISDGIKKFTIKTKRAYAST